MDYRMNVYHWVVCSKFWSWDKKLPGTSFLSNLYEFFNDSNLHLSFSSGVKPRWICFLSCRYMFWSDWGAAAKIEKCALDGDSSSRQVLVKRDIVWPNGLTIDYQEGRIWWVDARLGTVESMLLNGQDRKITMRNLGVRYTFGITVSQDSVYLTRRSRGRRVVKIRKNGRRGIERIQRHLYGPRGIVAYNPLRQPGARSK